MPRCRWGFSNLFVLLRRELLRITSAALETTPAPEWERSVLLRFAIKSSNNHLYAKHISHCFVSVFETFRRQHTEALKKKTRMFILLHNLSPVRCDVGEGGLSVRRGRSVGGGLRSPRSSRYGPHHRRLHGGVCSQEPDVLVEEERRLGKRNVLFLLTWSHMCANIKCSSRLMYF